MKTKLARFPQPLTASLSHCWKTSVWRRVVQEWNMSLKKMAVHQTLELYFLNNLWSCGILTSNEKKIAQHQASVVLFSLYFNLDIFSAAAENFSKSHLDSEKGISEQLHLSRNFNAGRTDTSKPIVHKHKSCSGCLKSECYAMLYLFRFFFFSAPVLLKKDKSCLLQQILVNPKPSRDLFADYNGLVVRDCL